jgi:hypothetical protein
MENEFLDRLNRPLKIGDWVIYVSYGLLGGGQINRFTKKMVEVRSESGNLQSLKYSNDLCIIDESSMVLYRLAQ